MSGIDTTPRSDTLELTCSEAREVIDHQIDTMNDLDDKAMWTLRLIVLFLGVFMTGLSVAVRANADLARFMNPMTITGFVSLGVSAVLSVIVYSSGTLTAGPGPGAIEKLLHQNYGEPWRYRLLTGYRNWMEKNEASIRRDATVLAFCQAYLVAGILIFFFGVVINL